MSASLEAAALGTDDLTPAEEDRLGEAVTEVLASVTPTAAFVTNLGQQLAQATQRELESQKRREQGLRIAGLVGGGVISIVGGLAVWLIWQKQHHADGQPGPRPVSPRGSRQLAHAQHSARP